jgi:hypothetical protein
MKRILGLAVCVPILTSGCSVLFSSPLGEQLGFRGSPITLVITNPRPLYGEVIVYEEKVGEVGPGGTVFAKRVFEPLPWVNVPVLIRFFRDPELTEHVGFAGRTFQTSSYGYGDIFSWTVEEGDIRVPSGYWRDPGGPFPPELRSSHIRFPRKWWGSTGFLQVASNYRGTAEIEVNGVPFGSIEFGGVTFIEGRLFYDSWFGWQNVLVVVKLLDGSGRLIAHDEDYFTIPRDGVWGYQFLITPAGIEQLDY